MGVSGDDVRAAAQACRQMLQPALDADWSQPVPGLEFTVTSVLTHLAETMLFYPVDLWGGPAANTAYVVTIPPDPTNELLLATLDAGAQVLAATVDAAPETLRGFHPLGVAAPEGFAAMACDELLVHGNDAARGLGTGLTPPPGLAERTLARLFPWHDAREGDPWQVLLWANGRAERAGSPFQSRWRWHCAPLSEWRG